MNKTIFDSKYAHVRVVSNTKNESVECVGKDRYIVRVKSPAERGLANARMKELLAKFFNINESQIHLISGVHTPSKLVSILKRE